MEDKHVPKLAEKLPEYHQGEDTSLKHVENPSLIQKVETTMSKENVSRALSPLFISSSLLIFGAIIGPYPV